jgi:UPF0716 family protein affecting phage T7 exclusion
MSTGEPQDRTPPVGEEIHMPGQSVLPIITAGAITLIVVGTTVHLIFPGLIWSLVGLVVLIICVYLWITSTVRDVSALPEEHPHS